MHQYSKHSFESFIIQCCKAKEWDLRRFLKKRLIKEGFTIKEDSYRSDRCDRSNKYNKVHNLLAVRGNPRVCLVAHTDVCRDHGWAGTSQAPDVFPVLKNWGTDNSPRMVIQDKDCKFQTGGDDRLGVAINMWLALNTGYDIALLFTTDEEIGLCSADEVKFSELKKFDLLVQVDRGNQTNQLVTRIGGVQLCSPRTTQRLLKISDDMGRTRKEVSGLCTDVQVIVRNGVAKEAVNMTCGYHNSFGDSAKEYIEVEEARSTMKFVSSIVQYYDLRLDQHEEDEIEEDFIEEIEEDIQDEVEIIDGEFDIENYIEMISNVREKNYKNVRRGNGRKRKYIEAIFDEDLRGNSSSKERP